MPSIFDVLHALASAGGWFVSDGREVTPPRVMLTRLAGARPATAAPVRPGDTIFLVAAVEPATRPPVALGRTAEGFVVAVWTPTHRFLVRSRTGSREYLVRVYGRDAYMRCGRRWTVVPTGWIPSFAIAAPWRLTVVPV